jgi:hypothetical protein
LTKRKLGAFDKLFKTRRKKGVSHAFLPSLEASPDYNQLSSLHSPLVMRSLPKAYYTGQVELSSKQCLLCGGKGLGIDSSTFSHTVYFRGMISMLQLNFVVLFQSNHNVFPLEVTLKDLIQDSLKLEWDFSGTFYVCVCVCVCVYIFVLEI